MKRDEGKGMRYEKTWCQGARLEEEEREGNQVARKKRREKCSEEMERGRKAKI